MALALTRIVSPAPGSFGRYRFPAIARTPARSLILAFEACPPNADGSPSQKPLSELKKGFYYSSSYQDFKGDPFSAPWPTSIMVCRSTDAGRTWSEPEVICQGIPGDKPTGFHNPSFIVDVVTGRVYLFYGVAHDVGFYDSAVGVEAGDRGIVHIGVAWSDDEGITWQHRDITSMVDGGRGWLAHMIPLGHGIQIRQGLHSERLLQAGVIRDENGERRAISIGSDDHGTTWWSSNPVGENVALSALVELSDGRILLTARGDSDEICHTSYSLDGGRTFGPVYKENHGFANSWATLERGFPCAMPGSAQSSVLLYVRQEPEDSDELFTLVVSTDNGDTFHPVWHPPANIHGTLDMASMPDQALCCVVYEDEKGICAELLSYEQLGIFSLAKGWNAKVEDQISLLEEIGLAPDEGR